MIATAMAPTSEARCAGKANLLRRIALFRNLNEAALWELAGYVRRRVYPPGVLLFHQGEEADRLFLILSGRVRIQRYTLSGRTVPLGLRGPGEHLGELSLLDGGPRMADAVTASECDLLILGREPFRRCLLSSPEVARATLGGLARRLREVADRLEARHELGVAGRLAKCLQHLAATEGVRLPGGAVLLPRHWTHQQLADLAGTTRESVTRALLALRAEGAIRVEGRPAAIRIMDEARLRERNFHDCV